MSNDPLLSGFFTFRDVARLLRMDNTRRVSGWVAGWAGGLSGPVIDRDFDGPVVSFLDLMEIRFVDHFRRQDVKMTTIRLAARRLREEWGVKHPLALVNSDQYLTDRRKIFAQAAKEQGDTKTWDMATNQYQMWVAIEATVAKNIVFDPLSQMAKMWRPLKGDFPNVVVDPRIAFGQPAVGDRPTPTVTLFSQWKANGGDTVKVADWFDIQPEDVDEAVGFELSLAA